MISATAILTSALMLAPTVAEAQPHGSPASLSGSHRGHGGRLSPRTHFRMNPDGSSGRYVSGAAIPNIDSVKSTIETYYGDTGDGKADRESSPYITQMRSIVDRQLRTLKQRYRHAARHHQKPALVFDTDDTTLSTYDMEAGTMHFHFDPKINNQFTQEGRFEATPGMVRLVNSAARMGYRIFGITGRNSSQKAATLENLRRVGYHAFSADRFYTKWTGKGDSTKPGYIHCAAQDCTTVEYKAQTREHIERHGYRIVETWGDQWSDLKGRHAGHTVKLPNPMYFLSSPNLPGVHQPWLSPRRNFQMEPDGSSGKRPDGEGIPNLDSVKSTIRQHYGAHDGIASKHSSPYIREMRSIVRRQLPRLVRDCRRGQRNGDNPAVVLDADDTTLWTYDMEDGAMHFHFDPKVQDTEWVQKERFPATPGMVHLVDRVRTAGCTIIGLTGRNDDQKDATISNLRKVGYRGFTAANYYTKWTGDGDSQQPGYIHCATQKCTTIEYKSQTRKHIESPAGGGFSIVANIGDQFSDLKGGHARRFIKLPNPTYYLP
ncbi:hypothetical protein GCM10027344_15890 [Spelaeicoccus albus]